MTNSYKAVIFDLDGTLLNTLNDLVIAVNHVLSENNEPTRTVEQIRKSIGNGNRMLMELSLDQGKKHPRFEELYREYVEYYLSHDTIETVPYDGIMDVLKVCHEKNLITAVISNKVQSATRHLVEHYFSGEFTQVFGDNEVRPRKPAPEAGIEICKELGVNPNEVLYIGDAPVDSDFSKAVGMDCILVSYGFNDREVLEEMQAIAVVDSPRDIIKYI